MLKVINQDIYITRGDTAYFSITLRQPSIKKDEYVIQDEDSCVLTVRKEKKSKENPPLIEKVFTDGNIKIDPADTADLEYGEYLYDVQFTFGVSGDVNTVISPHKFIVCEEVT